jgi:replicative DNA helicase
MIPKIFTIPKTLKNMKNFKPNFKPKESELTFNKPLPNAQDAEISSLGGCLLDNHLFDSVAENLKAEDFYSRRHQAIFKAMQSLWQQKGVIDPITVINEVKKQGDDIGSVKEVADLTFGLPHFSDLTDWIKIVKDKSVVRQIIKLCSYLIEISLSEEMTAEEILNYGEAQLYQIRDSNFSQKNNHVAYPTLIENSIKEMQRRAKITDFMPGLKTGFKDLDLMARGLQKDYIILAGRTSMGKSSMASDLVTGMCLEQPELVIPYFSLEMTKEEIVNRQIAQLALVDISRMIDGNLTKTEWEKVAEAATKLSLLNIIVDDTPSITPSYVRARIRRLKKEFGRVDGIVIDHGGLMSPDVDTGKLRENTNQISKELFSMKKEFDMFVLRLQQLNRKPDERKGNEPQLSDLKESGNLEEDADSVWFLHREEYYHKTDSNAGKANLLIKKARNGWTGTVPLTWFGFCTHFSNAAN